MKYPDQNRWHETNAQRAHELGLVHRFAAVWADGGPYVVYQNSPGSVLDATIVFGDTHRLMVETKTRNNPFNAFDDYTIDRAKIDNGMIEAHKADQPGFLLLVEWADRLCWYMETGLCTYPTTKQLRRDRNERADVVYHIPLWNFTPLMEN